MHILPDWLDVPPAWKPGAWREMAVDFGRALVLGAAAFLIAYGATRGFTLGRGEQAPDGPQVAETTLRIVLAKEAGK